MSTYPLVEDAYKCATCHDLRFIINSEGRTIPCPDGCNLTLAKHRLIKLCGVDQSERQLSFDTTFHKDVLPAAQYIQQAITKKWPSGYVYLSGSYGCGKSHLLKAAANYGVNNGKSSLYTTADRLLGKFRATFNTDESEEALLRYLASIQILCIDEVDRINSTDWAKTTLFGIMDMRYRSIDYGINSETRFTAIASNKPLEQLEGYLVSRLRDKNSKIFEMWSAPDYRELRAKYSSS